MSPPRAARTIALLHAPSPNMEHCQLSYLGRSRIDFAHALLQHANYCMMLRRAGVEIRKLAVNREFPDSVFIEDTAVVLDEIAVLASMGAESRRLEPAGIESELRAHRQVRRIAPPATLEGGDVLRLGKKVLVGVSSRTNADGVRAFEKIVRRFGYSVLAVRVHGCLHLKTACTALPDGTLLVNPRWIDTESLQDFELLSVPKSEAWGANVMLVGSSVFLAAQQRRTAAMIRERGFDVQTVDIAEFAKAEGGVTCLSILFSAAPS